MLPPQQSRQVILNDAGAGLPQIKVPKELDECLETFRVGDKSFQKMLALKDMPDVNMKVRSLVESLEAAHRHLKQQDPIGRHIAETGSFKEILK